jgi:hypothetical protein
MEIMDIYSITTQEILERISRHCPEALSAYIQCLNRADDKGVIFFSRSLIEIDMSEDFRSFRNNIKKLARENLLEWLPIDNGISVTLGAIDEDE